MTLPSNVKFNTIPEATNFSISELVDAAEAGERDDLMDTLLATARMLTTGPERYSLDDVLALFGYTREQLRQLDDSSGIEGDGSSL